MLDDVPETRFEDSRWATGLMTRRDGAEGRIVGDEDVRLRLGNILEMISNSSAVAWRPVAMRSRMMSSAVGMNSYSGDAILDLMKYSMAESTGQMVVKRSS